MDAQTYYDLNRTIERLAKVISHARYRDDRSGMIPVDAMGDVLADIADAVVTLTDLTNLSTNSKVVESRST
jgi:hypothetical protein